jgi:hypothetical protein
MSYQDTAHSLPWSLPGLETNKKPPYQDTPIAKLLGEREREREREI